MLPLALIPLVIGGITNYSINQKRARTESSQALQNQALLARGAVTNSLDKEISFAQVFVKNPLILDKVRRDRALAATEGLSDIPEESLEARFTNSRQLAPNPAFNSYLEQAATLRNFAEIIVTEAGGFNVGYSAVPSDFVQAGEAWWEGAKSKNVWFGDPAYDDSTGQSGVDFSQAIRDPNNNEFLGVVKFFITDLNFGQLSQYLADAGLQGSQRVQLLAPQAQSVLANFSDQGAELAQTPDSLDLIGGDTINEIAQRMAQVSQENQPLNALELQNQWQRDLPIQNLRIATSDGGRGWNDSGPKFRPDL
ncbi:MAG: hypothetical protein HC922_07850 [Leptolyngbyaceae cyanobacterium SM2_3_12]|nr:hypothetical protein [Leptolyngbyaceae cyanobacterium SM2_3_12]